ncbi:hypothetical protein ELE36_14745 [Pseudolysobacter antarcticus]|uniref:Uncharacterized protein n=1 Tax=Pseudolysobacter antarcticus TaxID=2511995 RepID=A0A411HLX4_9GAMM|nr:hypothetical protein [Pseudolysobacter antarcticus]QBB71511.1 hypothetical protein ELE36_14745 [Pseudolysobacter antarcticus]
MSFPLGRWVLAIALLDFAITNCAYIFWGDWSPGNAEPFIFKPMEIATVLSVLSIPVAWMCRSATAVRIFVGWFMLLAITHALVFFLIAFVRPAVG